MSGTKIFLLTLSILTALSCGETAKNLPRRLFLDDDSDILKKSFRQIDFDFALTDKSKIYAYNIHAGSGWKHRPIVLWLEEGMSDAIKTGITRAAGTWNQAVGFELITFSVTPAPAYKGNLNDRLSDNLATLDIENHWCRVGKSKQVLATTLWEYLDSTEEFLVNADIAFNGEENLFADALTAKSEPKRDLVDIESLALHELGHLLGLAHVEYDDDNFSVMHAFLPVGENWTRRTLSTFDIERIRYIYVPDSPTPPRIKSTAPKPGPQPTQQPVPTQTPVPCDFDAD